MSTLFEVNRDMLFENVLILCQGIASLRGEEVIEALNQNAKPEIAKKAAYIYSKKNSLMVVVSELLNADLIHDILNSLPDEQIQNIINYIERMDKVLDDHNVC